MRVLSIVHDSVVDGEGLRSVVFFSGCPHRCFCCHNPQSWRFEQGTAMTVEEVFQALMSNPLCEVTLSGGEPFMQAKQVKVLAQRLKQAGKHIWAYSGYTVEQLLSGTVHQQELLRYIDVLVDGPFRLERKVPGLRFRGSDNQRIWMLQEGKPSGLIFS
ncbi:anaerobic ribonucleoside-triphosphate reductase activating protein [Paenibacillus sp. 481]|uniref:anaerobic ribonucleoside-triphosphate reductase activating protein n=1 Tax=Paenibacillus sp. 481 TaxID=2835869 RepID=UPI001E2BFD5D|nr:anaerobic ribonucleoside-triphosphate reductase activating protein [Paenibacillus sp. 481]UHA75830.1 anaerobic ribonucleoside-triphosphate reductase activating protein [Paenibacillus sp. 481]